jgi:hypothetical protein
MALPLPAYVDGDFAVAKAVSQPVFEAPFQGVNINYVLRQDFMQFKVSYVPLPLNTPHPDFATFILVAETPQQDCGGGIVRWTRIYAQVPATYSQPQSVTYSFIGFYGSGGINVVGVVGRDRIPRVVAGRVQFDYFKLDQTTGNITNAAGTVVFTGTAGTLPSLVNIPVIQEQKYFQSGVGSVFGYAESDFIGYGPADSTPQVNYPVPNSTSNQPPYDAYPTRGVYESWVRRTATVKTFTPAATGGAAGTLTDTGLFEIVAQGSQVDRWYGNIVQRQTVYIRPA